MLEPDLTDPLVWELLNRNHVPEETLNVMRMDGTMAHVGHAILCEKDAEPWPCRIRKLLDNTDQPSRYGYDKR